MRTVHFVGMSEEKYKRIRASRIWGDYPHYYHKWMDDRVWTEVSDDDIVVVDKAKHSEYVWDASAVDKKWTD
ncbi:MAG: hypothetical protein N0C84_00690 [Candidatus Thiodiazotropha taylori]|uniref:Uncharacterized protein n=1 Tax=Candidatus Thiodiazotropha taylori TaxID=2792791 RepID=A0A9E4N2J6_9GAMM|nr:hypothetical protein [Candidatus Thiodiazotropha taylori]MCW4254962.1 hypothetical protein [Candidatus Thiodiazotropha taylori]